MLGRIHSFQSLGTVDGPGVRCVIFMQGCPLRCACCHNPDTWDFSGGTDIEVDDLIKKIVRFKSYFGVDGGVTVSGGEPLMQAEFLCELFTKLKTLGISTALDTSGCILNEKVLKLLEYTDIVLLDHKYSTNEDYKKYVGCDKHCVDTFLEVLNKKGIRTWLRRVIIPEINDNFDAVKDLAIMQKSFTCIEKTELLPFKKLCIEKYKNANIPFPLENTPAADEKAVKNLQNLLTNNAI